jgi:hypothetical protein
MHARTRMHIVQVKKELVSMLVRTFAEGTSRVTGDTLVETGAGSGGGEFATYRELAGVAADMGQPDLLYKVERASVGGREEWKRK